VPCGMPRRWAIAAVSKPCCQSVMRRASSLGVMSLLPQMISALQGIQQQVLAAARHPDPNVALCILKGNPGPSEINPTRPDHCAPFKRIRYALGRRLLMRLLSLLPPKGRSPDQGA
jgi:hypothetical protein